jgi:YTH domain-containing family protein
MSAQDHPPPPPVPPSPPNSGSVRRHHTISASSRTARAAAKDVIEESQEQAPWNDDEVVDEDWVGGVGAVGEKTSLHRQSSLPTRYHRGKFCLLYLYAMLAAVRCQSDH